MNTGGQSVTISNYVVSVKLLTGEFSTVCETALLECSLPMSAFLEAPFNFARADLIQIRVTAENLLGVGSTSPLSVTTVASVQTVPDKPSLSLTVATDETNETQIKLLWQAFGPGEDGNSDILSYNVQWDKTGTYTELVGYQSPYLLLELVVTNDVVGVVPG
jgi:hypothetical protein